MGVTQRLVNKFTSRDCQRPSLVQKAGLGRLDIIKRFTKVVLLNTSSRREGE